MTVSVLAGERVTPKEARVQLRGQRYVPSSRDACVKLSTTLYYRPAYGKEEAWGSGQSGWKNWLPCLMPPRKIAQALVGKGITIELFCTPGEIPLPAYR